MRIAYPDCSRLRSRKSTCIFSPARTFSAIFAKRYVFDISPGHVPSLRDDPQITSTRDFVLGFFCFSSAAFRRFRVWSHCTDRS